MITVYVKTESVCKQCDMTLTLMKNEGLIEGKHFVVKSAEENLDLIKDLGHMSAPVVIPDEGPGWGGFIPELVKTTANAIIAAEEAALILEAQDTVAERVGIKLDVPEFARFWELVNEQGLQSYVDKIVDEVVEATLYYVAEKQGIS